jgi:non-canonical (house-cleaning) NTP pyrophosphatase
MALKELGFKNYEIIRYDSPSHVSSKPIGDDIIRGADNRNQESKIYAITEGIEYDYLCAIEGGYTLEGDNLPFVVTYAVLEDANGEKSTGKSLSIRLRRNAFDYVKNGNSLNEAIEEIEGVSNNKHNDGITGYSTNGKYKEINLIN